MRRIPLAAWAILAALLCAIPGAPAMAQNAQVLSGGCGTGAMGAGTSPGTMDSAGMGCVAIVPAVTGYGTLAVSSSSVAASTLSAGPGSAAWAMPLKRQFLTIYNQVGSSGALYVCPLGGTCTSGGIEVSQGASKTFNLGASTTSPTLISSAGATAEIRW